MEYRVLFNDGAEVTDTFDTFDDALEDGIYFCLQKKMDNFRIIEVENVPVSPVSLAEYINSEYLLEQIVDDAAVDGIDLEILNDLTYTVYNELNAYLGKALVEALKKEKVYCPENVYKTEREYTVNVKNNGSRVVIFEVPQKDG